MRPWPSGPGVEQGAPPAITITYSPSEFEMAAGMRYNQGKLKTKRGLFSPGAIRANRTRAIIHIAWGDVQ